MKLLRFPFFNRNKLPELKYQFRPITNAHLEKIKSTCQEYADCYMMSTLDSLTHSKEGRKLLFKNVKLAFSKNKENKGELAGIRIIFNNVFKKKQEMFVKTNDYFDNINSFYKQKNFLVFAFKYSMHKLISKHPSLKPMVSRLIPFREKFEFNRPSNFMQLFTGKKPITIAESDININLKKYKKEVLALLKKMSETKNQGFSFIAGTGIKHFKDKPIANWHCLVIEKVDYLNQKIYIKNKRGNGVFELTFDEFLKKFKYITGYFNETLKA